MRNFRFDFPDYGIDQKIKRNEFIIWYYAFEIVGFISGSRQISMMQSEFSNFEFRYN